MAKTTSEQEIEANKEKAKTLKECPTCSAPRKWLEDNYGPDSTDLIIFNRHTLEFECAECYLD